jgi:O-antigen/teichoic acid export membrane protein
MMLLGSAQAVNILISVIRMKVLAMLLGPSGIGLLSIFVNLQSLVKEAAGLGIGSSSVRDIAASRQDETTLSRVRRVLFVAHLVQGTLALLAVWLLRAPIAKSLFGDATHATQVGLIGVAILMALLGTAQTALLQGMRQIADLGRITVLGAFAGTIVGLATIWWQGESGLIWFIIVQPMSNILISIQYIRRLPKPTATQLTLWETFQFWKPMAKLGLAFMLGGLATSATLLLVRGRISQELGLDAAGHFAAAWGLTMTYVGFLLSAMGADYYPRLTEIIHNKVAAVQLMNDQAQIGLAIGGPLLLLLIGLAPWVISLLYSKEFAPAVELLQWQSVGNVFKLAGWALGFSIVAAGRSKTFFLLQVNFNVIFLLLLWPTLTKFGIAAAGPAFTIAYLLQLAAVFWVVRVVHNFRWQPLSLKLLFLHGSLAVVLLAAAQNFPVGVAAASIALALGTSVFGIRVVLSKIGKHGHLPTRLYGTFVRLGWPIRSAN